VILHLPQSINKFFWTLFPFIFIIHSCYKFFFSLELQMYGLNELEDLGRLLFELGVSACESALIVIFIWTLFKVSKKVKDHNGGAR
jgi:hypothetical protein